jgi:hypothetical protein
MPASGRLLEIRPFPWRRPRRELLLVILVALAALPVVQPPNTQDVSRLCLSRALVAGRVYADRCLRVGETEDIAAHGGHLFTNKAPGMSVAELAPMELVRLPPPGPGRWDSKGDLRLWLVHLLVSGVAFVCSLVLVGRIAEGLAPGWGGTSLVVFGLGTEMGALGITGFDHVLTGMLSLFALLLASRRRPALAGLVAGAALTTEYEAAAIVVVLLAYTALQGRRALGLYAAGALPGIAVLGAYDWAAFGAPWRSSYRYLTGQLSGKQTSGLLGVNLPTRHGVDLVLFGERGLVIASPVLVMGAVGLVLVWRLGLRAEALVSGIIALGFLVAEFGYFDPYGGRSPGPRFFAAALPFLALGLGPAFARFRAITSTLAVVSVVASSALMLTWQQAVHYRETVWGEMFRVLGQGGSARLMQELPRNALTWDSTRFAGVGVTILATAGAAVASWSRGGRSGSPASG